MKTDSEKVVQVLYALPDDQTIVDVPFEPGMTAGLAVERSGLIEKFPSIADGELVLGIWGVQASAEQKLEPGDRVEISRPLQADPRDMRRELLTDGRVMGGAEALETSVKKKARE